MEKDKKNPLFEADYLEKALDFIDRYVKSTGKSPNKINALRAKIEDKIKTLNPNVSKSSAMKTFRATMDESSNTKLSKSDIEMLLEYLREADKKEPSKAEAKPKEQPKEKEQPKVKEQPKAKQKPAEPKAEEDAVSPNDAVQKLMKSSGGANFMQDVRRMGSKQDRIDAYLKLITSLPGVNNAEVRRAIVNKLKVSEK
jgi:hypothetical protein